MGSSTGLMGLLTQHQSNLLIPLFDLDDDLEEYKELVGAQGDTDGQSLRNYRREQHLLRKMLLDRRRIAQCGICGSSLPKDLLVAAHIKQRAKCSTEEKLDLPNIAMLMCDFGCDGLYEDGFIYVEEGTVKTRPMAGDPAALRDKLVSLEGLTCNEWSEARRGYFQWHRANVSREY
jgi:hypothetical protein